MKSKFATNSMLRYALIGAVLLAATALLAMCGGGSSPGPSGTTRGVITGFGSVIIDHRFEFQTSNLTQRMHLDDGPGDISGADNSVFRIGMVVTVHHGADDFAEEIEFENDLEGPVAGLAGVAPNRSFTVLGQPIVTDNGTFIEGGAVDNGAIVEVSGLTDAATGIIHATFIEVKTGVTTFEIKGFASQDNGSSFKLGQLPGLTTVTVNYSPSALHDVTAGSVSGFVEVKTDAAGAATIPITATRVERHDDIGHGGDDLAGHH